MQTDQGQVVLPFEAARVLQQTLQELENVRKTLGQPFTAKANVDAALKRLEHGLRIQSQDLLASGQQAAATAVEQHREAQIKATAKPVPYTPLTFANSPARKALSSNSSTPTKQRPEPHDAKEQVAFFKADPLKRPHTNAARQYLENKFGIPQANILSQKQQHLLQQQQQDALETSGSSHLKKGLSPAAAQSTTKVILPGSLRHNPYASIPPEYADMELDKGLFHLVNKGILPPKTDLTPAVMGGGGPVRVTGMPLLPMAEKHIKPPITSGLEDAMLANQHYKLDLLTPVIKHDHDAQSNATLHVTNMGDPKHVTSSTTSTFQGSHHEAGNATLPGDDMSPARQYNALMDTFSLHEFMIRKGGLISSTPEFESYKRTYEPLWCVIGPLIHQLELLSQQYALPLVVVDGRGLADLAQSVMETGVPPSMQDLLLCVQNITDVADLLRQPGRRFQGDGGQHHAAALIQATWRGHTVRTRYSRRGVAATTIQTAWRLHRMRAQLHEKLSETRRLRTERFAALQQQLARTWPEIHSAPHVILHMPSVRRSQVPATLSQKDALLVAEASQLARLTDLAHPEAEIILLLPTPPNTDVIAYWDKLLEVGGVSDASNRYRVMWPENCGRLPAHMSVAAMTMASPKTLQRLRSALGNKPGYIVPGLPGDEEMDLAVALGLPMLGPASHIARAMCLKSSARAMFKAAAVHVPPGLIIVPRAKLPPPPPRLGPNGAEPLTEHTQFKMAPDGHLLVQEVPPPAGPPTRSQFEIDEERVLTTVAEAAVRWPHTAQWALKIDDEVGRGAGAAYFKIQDIPGTAEVLNRTSAEESARGVPTPPAAGPHPPLTEAQRVAQYRLMNLLFKYLPSKMAIVVKEVYPNYRTFISAVAARGAVLEAFPEALLGSPQANLLVEPTGAVKLLSTHEKIVVEPFRCVGSTFPQSSVHPKALQHAAMMVGKACFKAGLIGHVSADFITLLESRSTTAHGAHGSTSGGGGCMRLWAVDITPCITPSLMAYQLFDFMTVGSWDPVAGVYTIPDQEDREDHQDDSNVSATPREPVTGAGGNDLPDPFRCSSHEHPYSQHPHGNPGHEEQGTGPSNRRSTMSPDSKCDDQHHERQRLFFSLDAITHPVMTAIPCTRLFRQLWQDGLHYDMDSRTGVLFNLSDRYLLGTLGTITTGLTPHHIMATMQQVLACLTAKERETYGGPISENSRALPIEAAEGLRSYREMQALVKYMSDKSAALMQTS